MATPELLFDKVTVATRKQRQEAEEAEARDYAIEEAYEHFKKTGDTSRYPSAKEASSDIAKRGGTLDDAALAQGRHLQDKEATSRNSLIDTKEKELIEQVKNKEITAVDAKNELSIYADELSLVSHPGGELGSSPTARANAAIESGSISGPEIANSVPGVASTKGLKGIFSDREEIMAKQEEARIRRDEETSNLRAAQLDKMVAYDKLQEELNVARREASEESQANIQHYMQELDTIKINPFRIYQNGFAAIGAAIATAIGAYAQGLSAGKIPNTALQIITKAEEMDLKAQQAEYQNAKEKVGLANNLFAKLMNQYGNEEKALLSYRAITLNYQTAELERRKAAAQSEEAMYTYDLLINANKIKAEESTIALQTNIYNAKTGRMRVLAMTARKPSGPGGLAEKRAAAAKEGKKRLGIVADLIKQLPEGNMSRQSWWTEYVGSMSDSAFWQSGWESLLPEDEVEIIGKLKPFLGTGLFENIRTADPTGKISDQDREFFKSISLNVAHLSDPAQIKSRLAAWNQIYEEAISGALDDKAVKNPETGEMYIPYSKIFRHLAK